MLPSFSVVTIGWSLLSSLAHECVDIMCNFSALSPSSELPLRRLVGNIQMLRRCARAWYERGVTTLTNVDQAVSCAVSDVLRISLHPFLAAHADALTPFVDQSAWRRSYCPVCGGRPDLSFLDKEQGNRWLLCSRCDAQWLFQRIECPFCENRDPGTLAYFVDDAALYRLYTCDRCRNYIKALDLRQTESPPDLSAERLLTADMDRQAIEQQYQPGWLTTPPRHS